MLSLQILFIVTMIFACWCAYKAYADEESILAAFAGFIWGVAVVPTLALIGALIWHTAVYLFA